MNKKVVIIGFGFMGRTHFLRWQKIRGARVVTVCDVNLARISQNISGNNGSVNGDIDLTGVRICDDFSALMDEGGFDIVDITLPTALHPDMTIRALSAGYHVFCEKPMALSAKLADKMVDSARATQGKLMIGQCLRFSDAARYVKNLIATGRYGKVSSALFSRVSMTPGWTVKGGANWFLDEAKSGGVALDLHIHDVDLINFFFGLPRAVRSRGHRNSTLGMDHITTSYDYGNTVVTAEANWGATTSFKLESTYRVIFEKAVVVWNSRAEDKLTVYPSQGKPFHPKVTGDHYHNELQAFLAYVNGKASRHPFPPEQARDSVRIVDAERKSARIGREVRIV